MLKLNDVCQQAIAKYGFGPQMLQAQEEAGELIAAISHYRRGRINAREELIAELADMRIMLEQLSIMFGENEVKAMIGRKLTRLYKKISDGGKKQSYRVSVLYREKGSTYSDVVDAYSLQHAATVAVSQLSGFFCLDTQALEVLGVELLEKENAENCSHEQGI